MEALVALPAALRILSDGAATTRTDTAANAVALVMAARIRVLMAFL